MKPRLLQLLQCPHCHGKLRLEQWASKERDYAPNQLAKLRLYCRKRRLSPQAFLTEVEEGLLLCKCKRWYPIINGVPRVLPDDLFNELIPQQREFLLKYTGKLPPRTGGLPGVGTQHQVDTGKSFGFQWTRFKEMYGQFRQNFLNYIYPITPSYFQGKLVMDAGCGFGRHTYYAAEFGAEVVGLDLSEAVDAAQQTIAEFPMAHIVQGDIYHPPFPDRSFDFVFSIGVLHHLPDPEGGFTALLTKVRKGGAIFYWLYGKEGRWFKTNVMEAIHKLALLLPKRVLYHLCIIPAIIYHTVNAAYNVLNRFGPTKGISSLLPFKYYAQFPFRVKQADAFDFLSTPVNRYYTKEQTEAWLVNAKIEKRWVTSLLGRSWRAYGEVLR